MAVIRPGESISKIAGSSGDHVYSSWKGRAVLRSKSSNRANPRSPKQAGVRAAAAAVGKAWNNDLTDDQKNQWNEAAQAGTPADDPASSREPGSRQVIPQPKPVLAGYDEFVRRNVRAIVTAIRAIGNPILVPSDDAPHPVTDLIYVPGPDIPINWALSMDGLAEDVSCGNVLSYQYTAAFAWEFWWWGKTPAKAGYIVAKQDSVIKDGYNIQWAPNILRFQIRRASAGELLAVSRVWSGMAAWHHFVITYDGSNNANGIRVYIDALVGQVVTSNVPITGTIINPNDLTFASLDGFAGSFGFQNMDCIRNFNRNLVQADVNILYNGGAGVFGPDPLADGRCKGCWPFCAGGGNTLFDIAGLNFHGTLRNMEPGDWIPGKVPCPDIPGADQIQWTMPTVPAGSKVRIWLLSYDAGVHRQHVVTVDSGVGLWIPDVVRVAQGREVPIASMPGHYLVQADVISPGGNQSPPSNTIEITIP